MDRVERYPKSIRKALGQRALVLVPAITAYRRPLERVAAGILSLYVLAALMGVGVVIGAVVVLEWPRLF